MVYSDDDLVYRECSLGNGLEEGKGRLGVIMKHISFSKKIILSSAFLVVIILCGVFCFGVAGSTNNTKNEGIVTYADLTPFEKQRLEK